MHRWHTRNPRPTLSPSLRRAILNRDSQLCQIRAEDCLNWATEVDHIIPVTRGGTNDPANLRAACAPCNAWWNYRCRTRPPTRRRAPERHPGVIDTYVSNPLARTCQSDQRVTTSPSNRERSS
ncbi:HNH endonuclease [Nocardia terpenica]|uniref:HNH endonuclease n=1 Tax=Nocardia terpenica TaxID=455432 RepID=UPI0018960A84|nr:HNH endonuclease signature motif containing protein [Nocardia terpenica]MBF6063029.1 HNH endonuclease [Nocardia terpenica]MBF6104836.1 HNH endonuclease [Nocardia terpenica]MBF6112728.1 HNH endonuclease [Nocardia terpenica]MBF6118564.1 HNH endonuclease [Nocardia terpenica]MBF6155043.1 HNH endonuclease [Nocardia terpenica]